MERGQSYEAPPFVPIGPVSVVLPVRDGEAFIREAVESIAAQTLRPAELIVVDDGSTDRTRDEVARAQTGSLPVRVIAGPERGISAAHNAGVRAASQPWIAVMHADDVAHPRRLERQMAAARAHPEVVAWGTYAYHINRDGRVLSYSESGSTTPEAFRRRFEAGEITGNLIHASALFRREAIDAVGGYDEAFEVAEDVDLFERMAALGPVLALPEPLLYRRLHGASISARRHRRMQQLMRYLGARAQARSRGETLSTSPRGSQLRRLVEAVEDRSVFHYHVAALRYADGAWLGAALAFALAVVLGARYAVPRAVQQLGPVMRMRRRPPARARPQAQLIGEGAG